MYFIIEGVAYCFMNMIYIKLLDIPVLFVKIILIIFSLSLIILSTYLIPIWNEIESVNNKVIIWNQIALIFTFYTINFFFEGERFYTWEEDILKRNIIIKFAILALVAISGSILGNYIKNDLSFVLTMIIIKTLIDFSALKKPKNPAPQKN
jgi:hypothetical protein